MNSLGALEEIKEEYSKILKMSCKLFIQVERMRVDNPMLNRPFMYNGQNLQQTLIRDQINIRDVIIKQIGPSAISQIDKVLDK